MNSRVSKARTRRSRVKLSNASQGKLLDAVARKCAEHSPSHREQPPVTGDLDRGAVPVQSTKRQLDATSEIDPSAKRVRLIRTDTRQPGVADEKVEQADKTALQQPKPKPLKRPYASFLKDFVDPVHKGPCPESVHTFVSEWLESVGSDRRKRCRLDSHLHRSDDEPVLRQLLRSAPEMGSTWDADRFVVPPTPASTGLRSYRADADTGSVTPSDVTGSGQLSARSLVEDPLYRDANLAENNIYMRSSREQFPEHIADLIDHVRRDRDSPGPSPDQVWQDTALEELGMGAGEPKVEKYFQAKVFPDCDPGDSLDRADRQPMARHTVPNTGSKLKVSNPVPNMLYGYTRTGAFTRAQQAQFNAMRNTMVANSQNLIYPFFVVEFKGDGPSGGGTMWAATNQCLGGSASCVNVTERLNHQLRKCKSDKIRPINSAAFSIAMRGTEARLYISWKYNELDYYMANVDSFLLQKPKDYLEFRKYVLNVIDWGKDRRLNEIRDSLGSLLEESSSEAAKSRPPPSDGSGTSSSKKRKSSSFRGRSSGTKSVQGQSGGAVEPYWEWNETAGQWFHKNADGTVTWAEEVGQSSSVTST